VLTHGSRTDGSEGLENQWLTPHPTLDDDVLNSIVVKGPWREETLNVPTRRRKSALKAKRRRRHKRGGWQARAGLKWAQVKEVFEFDKLARQVGLPLNAFFTIKPDWRCSTDQERKRDISRKIAHLGQAIKGRSRARRQIHFVGVTVYEKERSGVLHAHMLVRIEDFAFAKQKADGDIINVTRAKPYHLGYITKQRVPFGPEIDTTHWHRRQPGEKIVGVRLSFSMDAKALITAQRLKQSAIVSRLPSRPSQENHAALNNVQLASRSGVPELARAG
jgi:hypothetical protein